MRTKHLISAAVLGTASLLLTACGSALPPGVHADKLNEHQKEVIGVWYDAVPDKEQTDIRAMSSEEILAAAENFADLCQIGEQERGTALTKDPWNLEKIDAIHLADVIQDNLCEDDDDGHGHKPSHHPTGKPSTLPSKAAAAEAGRSEKRDKISTEKAAKSLAGANASHDLKNPAGPHDREEATLKAPANREPAWTHTDLGLSKGQAPHHDAAPAPKPAAPANPAPAAKAPAHH